LKVYRLVHNMFILDVAGKGARQILPGPGEEGDMEFTVPQGIVRMIASPSQCLPDVQPCSCSSSLLAGRCPLFFIAPANMIFNNIGTLRLI
jgi:hypothetical protein